MMALTGQVISSSKKMKWLIETWKNYAVIINKFFSTKCSSEYEICRILVNSFFFCDFLIQNFYMWLWNDIYLENQLYNTFGKSMQTCNYVLFSICCTLQLNYSVKMQSQLFIIKVHNSLYSSRYKVSSAEQNIDSIHINIVDVNSLEEKDLYWQVASIYIKPYKFYILSFLYLFPVKISSLVDRLIHWFLLFLWLLGVCTCSHICLFCIHLLQMIDYLNHA